MSTRFRVSTQMPARLAQLNISMAEVLRLAGLPSNLFDQQKVTLATGELFAFWRAIGEVSGDPTIGLKLGSAETLTQYDPIGIAALCTRTMREALRRISRYKQLTCPEEIVVSEGTEECEVQFRWLEATEAEPHYLTDNCFSWILSIARRGMNTVITPLRIELTRSESHARALREFFGCPVVFDAPQNSIVFNASDVDSPLVTHNVELLAMIAPQLEEELMDREAQQSFPDRVRAAIKKRLAGQRPSVREIAKDLRLSSRTLQRRLQESGSSFQQTMEEARRELARHYLIHSPLELNETAYLLGYEDVNSFVRAFHGWEGLPPAHWRQVNRMRAAEPPVAQSA